MTPKPFSSQVLPSPPQGKLVYSRKMAALLGSKNKIIRLAITRNYSHKKKGEEKKGKKKT